MGQEFIIFGEKSFLMNSSIISWIQKYMELFLLQKEHPIWFYEVLEDLNSNFFMPYIKYFFDKDIIGEDKERLTYCLEMLDLTILQMQSTSKREFFDFIKEDIKGTWCDISHEFYNDEWFNDEKNFKEYYIGSLLKLKDLMQEGI
ncbi:hypothetical protein [Flectobacillus rivi]|uniref:CdiI immunity protein domain-containing protein n=1 Tax=Flectobacillus rivi TaxID=2984209 RepID=A0ABT6YWD9_9BACT|nr:hypothetical protein [Flectobacillus rivi]MDI9873200.1 hypothetical protein [Flectobacillus rivi]